MRTICTTALYLLIAVSASRIASAQDMWTVDTAACAGDFGTSWACNGDAAESSGFFSIDAAAVCVDIASNINMIPLFGVDLQITNCYGDLAETGYGGGPYYDADVNAYAYSVGVEIYSEGADAEAYAEVDCLFNVQYYSQPSPISCT